MKKFLLSSFISMFFLMLFFSNISFADSPVTSTSFSDAYLDIPIVVEAKDKGVVDEKIAKELSNSKMSIDVKAAIINGLSWDIDGKQNAELYAKYILKKTTKELDISSLSGQDAFIIGYLKLMDDYFNPSSAIPYLEKAKKELPSSFTVSMINGIAKAQVTMNMDFGLVWEPIYKVIENKKLKVDMRKEAIDLILEYMRLYEAEDIKENINLNYEDTKEGLSFTWNSNDLSSDVEKYVLMKMDPQKGGQLEHLEDFSLSEKSFLDQDIKNGGFYMYILYGMNKDEEIMDTSNLIIVSPFGLTKKSYSSNIVLQIGSPYMMVNNKKVAISENEKAVPIIKDGRTLLPIRAIVEAMGGFVEWDKNQRKVTIYKKVTTLQFWIDQPKMKVNNEEKALDVSPEIINGSTMLPVRYVAEYLNCEIKWNGEGDIKEVIIRYND